VVKAVAELAVHDVDAAVVRHGAARDSVLHIGIHQTIRVRPSGCDEQQAQAHGRRGHADGRVDEEGEVSSASSALHQPMARWESGATVCSAQLAPPSHRTWSFTGPSPVPLAVSATEPVGDRWTSAPQTCVGDEPRSANAPIGTAVGDVSDGVGRYATVSGPLESSATVKSESGGSALTAAPTRPMSGLELEPSRCGVIVSSTTAPATTERDLLDNHPDVFRPWS
jgi:hypothetical protein